MYCITRVIENKILTHHYFIFKNTIKLENCLLQVECKRGPERTISGSKFSNITSIYLKIETYRQYCFNK